MRVHTGIVPSGILGVAVVAVAATLLESAGYLGGRIWRVTASSSASG